MSGKLHKYLTNIPTVRLIYNQNNDISVRLIGNMNYAIVRMIYKKTWKI